MPDLQKPQSEHDIFIFSPSPTLASSKLVRTPPLPPYFYLKKEEKKSTGRQLEKTKNEALRENSRKET
jgi:hypothetical protein